MVYILNMQKVYVTIIEDNKEDLDNEINYFNKYGKEKNIDFSISHFSTSKDFFDGYKLDQDIIVLDIDLEKGGNGLEIAKKIREFDSNVLILFVTNLAKYACKGYEVEAVDFLIKPVRYDSFTLRMDKAIKILDRRVQEEYGVSTNEGYRKVPIKSIKYIEVESHDVKFYLDNNTSFLARESLKFYENDLKQYGFSRCNNCYLVNLKFVTSIDKYECRIKDEVLQISHPKRRAFVNDFMNYLMKFDSIK